MKPRHHRPAPSAAIDRGGGIARCRRPEAGRRRAPSPDDLPPLRKKQARADLLPGIRTASRTIR